MKQLIKRDNNFNWQKAKRFIPKDGEIIIYDFDTETKFKIGNGISYVNDLPFAESYLNVKNVIDETIILGD